MSARYYILTALLVLAITAGISVWKEKRTAPEIFKVLVQVLLSVILVFAAVFAFAKLLEYLGIAQSGFVVG